MPSGSGKTGPYYRVEAGVQFVAQCRFHYTKK